MTSKQSQYTITYDDFNDSFLCVIDGETISANFVGEILSYIAKLYDYEPKIIYSELHYAKVLENELNINIEIELAGIEIGELSKKINDLESIKSLPEGVEILSVGDAERMKDRKVVVEAIDASAWEALQKSDLPVVKKKTVKKTVKKRK